MAAPNEVEKSGDVMNTYITALCSERILMTLGPEFGADAGKNALIMGALYGLKSSGAAFRIHLGVCMKGLGYLPWLVDPDLWYKAATKKDGTAYYSFILCYVDIIMVIHENAMPILQMINSFMKLKPDSIGDADIYLGAKLNIVELSNDTWCWSLSPSKYVQEVMRSCKKHLTSNFDNE